MTQVKSAVILAGGTGSRFPSFTRKLPKGFLPVGGVPIIERSIMKLLNAGIEEIVIGTGYKSEEFDKLASRFPAVVCKRNDSYRTTGSLFTLHNLQDLINRDFLLLESDLLYERMGLVEVLTHPKPNVILASGLTDSRDEVFLEVDPKGILKALSKDRSNLGRIYGELTGISKVSVGGFHQMLEFAGKILETNPLLDYEYAMVGICDVVNFYVHKIEDFVWCEIDDQQHWIRAKTVIYPKLTNGKHE